MIELLARGESAQLLSSVVEIDDSTRDGSESIRSMKEEEEAQLIVEEQPIDANPARASNVIFDDIINKLEDEVIDDARSGQILISNTVVDLLADSIVSGNILSQRFELISLIILDKIEARTNTIEWSPPSPETEGENVSILIQQGRPTF